MFGNVNVDYKPCKSKVQLERAAHYILGKLPEQISEGIVKTAPNLYWGMNCDRDNFARDILMTRKLFGKRETPKTNLAFKMSISFSPDDNDKLTYDEVFRIAMEFAEKYFKGYEVLFAVHTDKPHKHVHFLVGNCHTETGKAYRRSQKDLYDMCEFFGEQCMQRGLTHSVRDSYFRDKEDNSRDKETFAERQMKAKGKETFKDELREVIRIECADPNNKTLEDVVNALMKHYHVECRVKGNTISYRHPEYTDKNGKLVSVRGSKLGDKYTVKGIEHELEQIRRGRSDRDLAGTAVITETGRRSDNIGTDRQAGDQEKAPRADTRAAGRTQTSVRTSEVTATAGEAQEAGKVLLHTGDASQGRTAGQESEQTKTQAGGNSSGKQESSPHSGAGSNRDLGSGADGGDSGDLGRCQEGREGHAHGNVGDKDVPSLEELFRSYDRRNGKERRKRVTEPEPTEPVRKKRKGIVR